ncbi:MAG: hypothetical protein WBD36_11330 [Bacteroidota bacterium]
MQKILPGTRLAPLPPVDPLERIVPLGLQCLAFAIWGSVLVDAADAYSWMSPKGPQTGFLNSMLHMWIDLPIHEGGHMLFFWLGRTMTILGGSFWQIAFPLIWFGIAIRQRHWVAPHALIWGSVNMLDVSLYMRDAPFRIIPLLGGGHSGHDWYNLFRGWDMLKDAEMVADVTYYTGIVVGWGAIVCGVAWATYKYFNPAPFALESAAPVVLPSKEQIPLVLPNDEPTVPTGERKPKPDANDPWGEVPDSDEQKNSF